MISNLQRLEAFPQPDIQQKILLVVASATLSRRILLDVTCTPAIEVNGGLALMSTIARSLLLVHHLSDGTSLSTDLPASPEVRTVCLLKRQSVLEEDMEVS